MTYRRIKPAQMLYGAASARRIGLNEAQIKLKKRIVQELKGNRPCVSCRTIYPPECMDLHHRIPEEKSFSFQPKDLALHSVDEIVREINKCDVICANCHRTKHRKVVR